MIPRHDVSPKFRVPSYMLDQRSIPIYLRSELHGLGYKRGLDDQRLGYKPFLIPVAGGRAPGRTLDGGDKVGDRGDVNLPIVGFKPELVIDRDLVISHTHGLNPIK